MFKLIILSFLMAASALAQARTPRELTNQNLEGVYFINRTYAFVIRKIGEDRFEWRFACTRRKLLVSEQPLLVCTGVVEQVVVKEDGTVDLPVPINNRHLVWLDPLQPGVIQSKNSWYHETRKSREFTIENVVVNAD